MSQVDVRCYARDGYAVSRSVLGHDQVQSLRQEANRLLELCTRNSDRYGARIEWEVDHLADSDQAGMHG